MVTGTHRLGEIATRTGPTPDARRFYERLGLLPRYRRTAGGFRIDTSDSDGEERPNLRELVATKLAQVDATLNELWEYRGTVKSYFERSPTAASESRDAQR